MPTNDEIIKTLEQMLHRMKEGFLGCSGFSAVDTEALGFAIKALQAKEKEIQQLWEAGRMMERFRDFYVKENKKLRKQLKPKKEK